MNKFKLKGTKCRIQEQFNEKITNERKSSQPLIKKAIADEKSFYVKYNKLIIDDKTYMYDYKTKSVQPIEQNVGKAISATPSGENVNQSEDTLTDLVNEKRIQILARNVDKLQRHTKNPERKEVCSGYDIICAIETWGRSQNDFSDLLETHEAFPCIRSEAENFSGGIIVYINKHILPGCVRIF